MNPISPAVYARAATLGAVLLVLLFLLAGLATGIAEPEQAGRGFFELRLQLSHSDHDGAPFWILALAATLAGHGLLVKKFAFSAATVTRGGGVWFGFYIPFPCLRLLGSDLVLAALVPFLFFFVRSTNACI